MIVIISTLKEWMCEWAMKQQIDQPHGRSYPASAPHYAIVFFSMQLKGQLPILSCKMFLTARNNNLTWLESEMSLLVSLFLSLLTMPSHIHKTQFWIWATTLYWRATGYTALGWLQGQLCSWKKQMAQHALGNADQEFT